MERTDLSDCSWERLAAYFARVYAGYAVPVAEDPDWIRRHVQHNDVIRQNSPLWLDDQGKCAALALLGVRERRGWIGGFGVAPDHRGRGLAGQLLAEVVQRARVLGLSRLQLEVLCQNEAALAVYRRGGFQVSRKLAVLVLPGDRDSAWQRQAPTGFPRVLNETWDSPQHRGLLALGWQEQSSQWEMILEL